MSKIFQLIPIQIIVYGKQQKNKRPIARILSINNEMGQWTRKEEDKVEVFIKHLQKVFRLQDKDSDVDTTKTYRPDIQMRRITPLEIAGVIDTNINPKKAPGIDEIALSVLKELTKKT